MNNKKRALNVFLGLLVGIIIEVIAYLLSDDIILLIANLTLLISGLKLISTKHKLFGIGVLATLGLAVILMIISFVFLTRLH
jgi:hypothetical protein